MTRNAITIDLEDWFHAPLSIARKIDQWPAYESRILDNTEKLLAIFKKADVRATFFVLGYVANQYPNLIRRIADNGHEIGLHSYHHQRVSTLDLKSFYQDVVRNLETVQNTVAQKIIGYRAPMFSIDEKSLPRLEILKDLGLRYDSSVFPIQNPFYGIKKAPRYPFNPIAGDAFVEFPIATLRFLGANIPCGGGFYFRALPYLVGRAGIRQLNCQGYPAVIYFHPWEFDLGQDFQQLTRREMFTHYHGRAGLEKKFVRLLGEFNFVPLSELLNQFSGKAAQASA